MIFLLQVYIWLLEAVVWTPTRPIPPLGLAHSLPTCPSSSFKDRMPGSAPLCWGGVGGQQYGRCAGRHPHIPLHHRFATTTTLPQRDGRSPQPRRWAKTLTPPQRSTTAASSPTTTMWLKVRRWQRMLNMSLCYIVCVLVCPHVSEYLCWTSGKSLCVCMLVCKAKQAQDGFLISCKLCVDQCSDSVANRATKTREQNETILGKFSSPSSLFFSIYLCPASSSHVCVFCLFVLL